MSDFGSGMASAQHDRKEPAPEEMLGGALRNVATDTKLPGANSPTTAPVAGPNKEVIDAADAVAAASPAEDLTGTMSMPQVGTEFHIGGIKSVLPSMQALKPILAGNVAGNTGVRRVGLCRGGAGWRWCAGWCA
jgi:hypothetical protein